MDNERFDRLARALGAGASRRGALKSALSVLLAGSGLAVGADALAGKDRDTGKDRDRKRGKGRDGDANAAANSTYPCTTVADCQRLDPHLCSTGQCTCQGRKCKVTICHATSSASNPYVEITVAFDAADDDGDGHDGHQNDIIPAPRNGCPSSPGCTSSADCNGGCCDAGVCRADRKACGGVCIAKDACCTDSRQGCPTGQTCASGRCACSQGQTCGNACCTNGQACVNGACTCPAGALTCGSGCCGDGQICRDGRCACPSGGDICGATCCPAGQTCSGGVCVCPAGQAICGASCCPAGQSCVDGACQCLTGDTCGDVCCGEGQSCIGGACACASGETCGASCCPAGQTCQDGVCACPEGITCGEECAPAGGLVCTGRELGCVDGAQCGEICCASGQVCVNGACACPEGTKPCGGACIPNAECCTDGTVGCPASDIACQVVSCRVVDGMGTCTIDAAPDRTTCGATADVICCGGLCLENATCCADTDCAPNEVCSADTHVCVCQPVCADKACGDPDGCGGSCNGACAVAGETCSPNGAGGHACGCDAAACAAEFGGAGICCGAAGQSATCVDSREAPNCGACGNACTDPGTCNDGPGTCNGGLCVYTVSADGASCGETGEACCSGACCASDSVCFVGACCRPLTACPEGVCGTSVQDGCGNWIACPPCPCVPECPTDWCGGDGCGGSCAALAGAICNTSTYVDKVNCIPNCAGRQCGADGCGGICGFCPDGAACDENTGACTTTPTPAIACATLGEDCTEIPSCANSNQPLTCTPNREGHISEPPTPQASNCAHAGQRPGSGGKCCPRLHLEGGICVINRWDHCDPSNRGRSSFCENGTRCTGGRKSPHGTPVCVPNNKRRGRGGESIETVSG